MDSFFSRQALTSKLLTVLTGYKNCVQRLRFAKKDVERIVYQFELGRHITAMKKLVGPG